jgi:hypothetical protein
VRACTVSEWDNMGEKHSDWRNPLDGKRLEDRVSAEGFDFIGAFQRETERMSRDRANLMLSRAIIVPPEPEKPTPKDLFADIEHYDPPPYQPMFHTDMDRMLKNSMPFIAKDKTDRIFAKVANYDQLRSQLTAKTDRLNLVDSSLDELHPLRGFYIQLKGYVSLTAAHSGYAIPVNIELNRVDQKIADYSSIRTKLVNDILGRPKK